MQNKRLNLSLLDTVQVMNPLTELAFLLISILKNGLHTGKIQSCKTIPGSLSPLVEPGQLDGGGMACSASPPGSLQDLGLLDLSPSPWPGQVKASDGAGSKAELRPPATEGVPRGNIPAFGSWETTSGFSPLMFPCTSHVVLLRQGWSTSADAASVFKATLGQLEQ